MKHNDGKETDIRMKHNDEKETDIRMSAEKSKERSIEKNIEKSKEKGKETNTEKNTDHRKKSHEMDMLNGSLALKMLIFAMPLAASSILQQLFNSADVAVAGRFAGSDALAAVGSNAAVVALFVNVFVGLSVGVNVLVAHYIGQNKKDSISRCVHTSVKFALICGIVMLVAGMFVARPILEAIDTPERVLDQAVLYLRIYFVGMPFIILYNFGAAVLRAIGDTRRPLYCLIVSGVLNVVLNLFFVCVCKLGVAGVGMATVISNVVSTGIVMYILMHEEGPLRLDIKNIRIDKVCLGKILRIGAPSAIQTAVFSLSNVLIQGGINSFGPDAVAGSSTGLNFEYFAYFVISAYAQAAVTFVSQNYGAGEKERCRKALRIAMLEGMLMTAVFSSVMMLSGDFLVRFYTTDTEVIKYALIRMKHVMLLEAMTGTYEMTAAALRGLGRSMLPAIITVVGSVVFRIIWIYTVFARYHSFGMLLNVYIVSWIITGTTMIIAYILVSRKVLGHTRAGGKAAETAAV